MVGPRGAHMLTLAGIWLEAVASEDAVDRLSR